ncbi:polyamine ABC transporter substrate-binding protein [Kaistia terrae]|uniref:Putrescine-binding periplasmic protein n=1 Tax=Kaistia terrae TaxID=537017 RepID=A0ABW0PWD5_9HYPH|nr:polyamine ABC transporter substrate-binding protein [Kaistia terrae]MCX5579186.1 polyamine ABC transporter substrate-binding protein [Kaistia terrae]
MIKNAFSGVALSAMLTVGAVSGANAADKELHIFNWSDYIDTSIIEDFTKETGIKVVYDVYDSMEILETKMLAGGSGYDIVVPTDRNLKRMIDVGVFQDLDKSKIPNLSHMWDEITTRLATYDPGNKIAVNYMWGTTGIGYNVEKIKAIMPDAPVDSMDMFFNPEVVSKFKDCGVYLLDSPDDVIPAALNYLGLPPDSKDPAEIAKAGELLDKIRPFIRKFHSSEYIQGLANGDICLAFGYSGDVIQARARAIEANNKVEVGYAIPKEGGLLWMDSMAIPKDAPNPEAALAFINYIQKPEVIAKATNYVSYANGNKDSQSFVDKAILDDPTIYPPADVMKKLYTTTPNDPKVQRVVTRLWTKIKSGT